MSTANVGQVQELPAKHQAVLTGLLEDGEELIWFAQPNARWRRRSAYSSAFCGLVFIAVLVHFAPWERGGWWWLTLIPAVFALVLVASPFLMQAFARSTLYAITGRRVVILRLAMHEKIRCYPIGQLPQILMRPRTDGSGDLIFETVHYQDADGYAQTREHGFEDILEVGMVQQIVNDLVRGKDPEAVRRHAALWRLA